MATPSNRTDSKPTAQQILAANVRRLRGSSGTQRDLAEAAGVRQALISSIELGEANPTLSTLERIARAFKVDVWQLLAESSSLPKD